MTERAKAPGALRTLQDFVNTADLETAEDAIASPDALRDWLASHGLIGPAAQLGDPDVARAGRVREALRDLLAANAGERPDAASTRALDDAAAAAEVRLRFDEDGRSRLDVGAEGVAGGLGRLLLIANEAMADGTWERLKVCRDDACRWAFYDGSRNRSGAWCAMAVCGNREKVRSYRSRRRGSEQPRLDAADAPSATG